MVEHADFFVSVSSRVFLEDLRLPFPWYPPDSFLLKGKMDKQSAKML